MREMEGGIEREGESEMECGGRESGGQERGMWERRGREG